MAIAGETQTNQPPKNKVKAYDNRYGWQNQQRSVVQADENIPGLPQSQSRRRQQSLELKKQ